MSGLSVVSVKCAACKWAGHIQTDKLGTELGGDGPAAMRCPACGESSFLHYRSTTLVQDLRRALLDLVNVCDELDVAGHQVENARELVVHNTPPAVTPPVDPDEVTGQ